MNSRTLLNLSLAAVALLLALLVYFRPGLESDVVPPAVTSLSPGDISSIRVTRNERTPLHFEKRPSGWVLANHDALPASEFQLHALLGILEARPQRHYPQDSVDLAGAGLQPPQASMLLDETVIDIGSTTPLDAQRYIRHGDTVYLVRDTYQHLVNADWSNFVERGLLLPGQTLAGLQLPAGSVSRDSGDGWQFTPATGRDTAVPDAAVLAALVQHWESASATYIRRFSGGDSTGEVVLTTAPDQEQVRLLVMPHASEFILARPDWGIQYHLPGHLRHKLLEPSTSGDEASAP